MPLPTYAEALATLRKFYDGAGTEASKKAIALEGGESLAVLPGGAVYVVSDLDLDTDGGHAPGIRWESTHQDDTSLHDSAGKPVDSNTVPFVVLPGGWGAQFGLRLSDVGLVLYNNRAVAVICADIGPKNKIGEGSIALHRALGFERVKNGRIVDVGIDNGVRTVLFPGSGAGVCVPYTSVQSLVAGEWVKLTAKAGL